jgi:tungstate transport system substrate-binding protein
MGATLNAAAELRAYALADRGTWLSFRNRGDLRLLLAGDPPLRNPYGFLVVSPERHPHAAAALAERLGAWLVSDEGRAAIADFRVGGEPLFFPAARGPAPEPAAPRGAAAGGDD